jgi:lysophospholipase L1-like esterase
MRRAWRRLPAFWRDAALGTMILGAMAGAEAAANVVFRLPHGQSLSRALGILRSEVILYNPAVTGYYEALFARDRKTSGKDPRRPTDRSFRMMRLTPGVEGWTNRFGLIGHEIALEKPPNTRRVAIFGASLAEGFGATDSSRCYPASFEQHLNAAHAGGSDVQFEVLNFGVAGYKLTQIVDVEREEAPRFAPDVYLLEMSELQAFKPWDEHLVKVIRAGIDLKYDYLREIARQAGAGTADDSATLFAKLAPFRIPALRAMLLQAKSLAADQGAAFVVMLVPAVEDWNVTRRRIEGIPELLASLNIMTVDVLDTFDNVADLDSIRRYPADIHPNDKGYAMIAANLYATFQAKPAAWAALTGKEPPGGPKGGSVPF